MGDVVEIRPCVHVGVFAGDQPIGDFFALVHIEEHDGGSERNTVPRYLVEVHQRKIGQPLFQLAEPYSHEVLPLAGGGVVGVFAEVAKCGSES